MRLYTHTHTHTHTGECLENKKLKLESLDCVSENVKKIREILPNCVTETEDGLKIDYDVLKQELSNDIVEGNKEKYQLTWPGKKEAILTANTPCNRTLRPIREKSVDFDNTKNIYIEGDNLEVLKILQESYLNKIKCIYIDPPYNTGNDFIYNDKFVNEDELEKSGQIDKCNNKLITNIDSNGKFHSDWLSMMYARLKVARNLLKNDGVIFISIDDNELANLKRLCDEIFGENNFIGCFTRATGTTTGQDGNKVGSSLDYCLTYSKSENFSLTGIELDEKDLKRFTEKDEKGVYSSLQLRKTGNADRKEDRPNMFYPIAAPDGSQVYPFGPTNYLSRWRVAKNTFEQLCNDNMIIWKEGKNEENIVVDGYKKSRWIPYVKYYAEGRTKQVSNLLQNIDGNKKASIELKELFESKSIFSNPKPTEFIKLLLQISNLKENDIILDFFSGSGTTGHAVMKYNSTNNLNTRFIMIQIPEKCDETTEAFKSGYKNICELGEERIKRAGKAIKEETNADIDYGFRVYKVDSSNMKDVYYTPTDLKQSQLNMFESNIKEDRTAEDLLIQVILDLGLTLDLSIEKRKVINNNVYFVENNNLVACFDDTIDINIVDEICKCNPLKIVFKESSFKTDSDKINVFERIKKLSSDAKINII